jgi:hypothetical protein
MESAEEHGGANMAPATAERGQSGVLSKINMLDGREIKNVQTEMYRAAAILQSSASSPQRPPHFSPDLKNKAHFGFFK